MPRPEVELPVTREEAVIPDFTVKLSAVSGGQKVDSRSVEPLNQMLAAMKKEGMRLLVCSGYRSVERQSQLFEDYIEEKLNAGWRNIARNTGSSCGIQRIRRRLPE